MNSLQSKTKFLIIYAVILSSLILSLMLIKYMFIPQTKPPDQKNIVKLSVSPTKIPERYIRLEDSSASAVLEAADPSNKYVGLIALLYSSKPVTIPALLSDYDSILVINNYSDIGFSPIGSSFSPSFAGPGVNLEANVLMGTKYIDANGIIRATLIPNGNLPGLGHSGIQITARDSDTFTRLLIIAEKITISSYPDYYNLSETNLPRQIRKRANYTDPDHPYTYYLPNKYRSQSSPQGYPNVYFASSNQDNICLSFKEDHNDPCGFSTSGCTCCNTGCELLDYVIYATRDGLIRIDPIIQKGKGQGTGTRFVYDAPHPWLYYTATYSSPINNPQGVLDLIYLLDSMDRNY